MNIKFLGTKVSKFYLEVNEPDNGIELDDNYELSFANGFSDDNSFIVKFSLNISSKKERYNLDLDYIAFFLAEDEITDDFINSHFPSINAPAIAFPFMRSYISTITVNSGLKPLILPTINFQELAKSQKDRKK